MKKKNLIIILIFLCFFSLLLFFLFRYFNQNKNVLYVSSYKAKSIDSYSCLKKGNVCSKEDIYHAMKVSIPVNDIESYDFYLLSNDAEAATYIMDHNLLDDVNWHNERINLKGPTNVFRVLAEVTNNWTSIPIISSYEYKDYGQELFQEFCDPTNGTKDELYDCNTDKIETRGYLGLEITDGDLFVKANLPTVNGVSMMDGTSIHDYPFRVRIPSYEEIWNLNKDFVLPDWLMDHLYSNGSYWTMSSSTLPGSNYMQGVFAVANYEGNADLLDVYSKNDANSFYNHTGIRPVITLEKKD